MRKPRVTRPSRKNFSDSEIFTHMIHNSNSCRFMGRKLPEGTKICDREKIYICQNGDWESTGEDC